MSTSSMWIERLKRVMITSVDQGLYQTLRQTPDRMAPADVASMVHEIPEMGMSEMSDASNVRNGGMGRRVSEVRDLILQMAIVPPSAATDFVGKLAQEQEWPRERAQRAYDEYLRFLLMAWVSPGMVVPSHDVDQAWHLHLTHSRHYWDVLCGEILQRPFHHDPSLGGNDEDARHGDAYRRTLQLYAFLFDEEAPTDVWPRGCTCAVEQPREAVLASPAWVGILIFGMIAALMVGYAVHPFAGIVVGLGTVAVSALIASSEADERRRQERSASYRTHSTTSWSPGVSSTGPTSFRHAPTRSTAKTSTGSGRTSTTSADKSSTMSSSGDDTSLAFLAVMASSDASASTGSHGSGSHSHGSSHSSHSDSSSSHSSSSHSSSHSSHSCGGSSSSHSCGSSSSSSCGGSSSSCGGSSCGGGGCGGS